MLYHIFSLNENLRGREVRGRGVRGKKKIPFTTYLLSLISYLLPLPSTSFSIDSAQPEMDTHSKHNGFGDAVYNVWFIDPFLNSFNGSALE